MNCVATLLLTLVLQAVSQAPPPVARIVVGLVDGKQLTIQDPQFTGFIQGRSMDAVLSYRQEKFHGRMPTATIGRIDFGAYSQNRPFALTVTLRNGQRLEVQSEHHNFVTLTGRTDTGTVTIKHPDPLSTPLRLSTKAPDRKKDLTIQYLEFPASQ